MHISFCCNIDVSEVFFIDGQYSTYTKVLYSVIGTPHEREWPRDVSLNPSNFRNHPRRPVRDVVPEITDDAADLLQVRTV